MLLEEAAALAERLGMRRLVAMALGNVTQLRLAGGDLDGAARAAMASVDASLAIGDVGIALDAIQAPIDVAEIRGDRELAGRWWREHALLEERLGRPHDCAISWFRHAAVTGDRASLAAAEAAAEGLDTEDLTLHRARAEAAVGGPLHVAAGGRDGGPRPAAARCGSSRCHTRDRRRAVCPPRRAT